MRTEDGYIINKCLNGEPEAFGFLVDKYKESVYAFAYTRLHNFHDAEDVVQEVFIKAYQRLHTLRHWESFLAWLYSITSNLCKMHIRSQSKRPDREYVEDEDPKILDMLSLNSYHEKGLRESVREALDALPEMQRRVLMLHYLGGMKINEVARFLGASPRTIARRLDTARSQLKEEIFGMMTLDFEMGKLPAGFTLRIMEMVSHIRIYPMPRMTGLSWGLSLATGIIFAILSFGSYLSIHNPVFTIMSSASPGDTQVSEIGEIPVDISNIPQLHYGPISQGYGNGGGPGISNQQNAVLMAPGEVGKIPEEPSARFGRGRLINMMFSPDGTLIAIAGSASIWLHDANNLDEIALLECATYSMAFSPDSETLASGMLDGTITLWDIKGKKQIGSMAKHTGAVISIAFSPDGGLIASGGEDTTVRLWDIKEQKQIAVLEGHTGTVGAIACSPDGGLIASGGEDTTVRLWDVKEQKQIAVLEGHTSIISSVVFNPDGDILASGSYEGEVILWRVKEQKQINVLPTGGVSSVDFSPDGQSLVVGGNEVSIWNIQGEKKIQLPKDYTYSASLSPDGKLLMTMGTDYTIRLWDIQQNKQIGSIDGFIYNSNCIDLALIANLLLLVVLSQQWISGVLIVRKR